VDSGVFAHGLEARVHHLAPEEAGAQFASHPHPLVDGHALLVRRVEVDEAQEQLAAVVLHAHQQLPAPAQLDAALGDDALTLHGVALARLADRRDAGLVLVAVRQVQGQVDVAHKAHFLHRLLWRGFGFGLVGRWTG